MRKTRVSIESLLDELETTIADARVTKQHSVVIQALTLSAKLVGLLRERVEIGGVGEFSRCESPDDLMRTLLVDMTPAEALASLDDLRARVEVYAANHATLVPGSEPQEPGSEGDRSLAAFRRRR